MAKYISLVNNTKSYLTKARKLLLNPYLSGQVDSWLCSPHNKHVSNFYTHKSLKKSKFKDGISRFYWIWTTRLNILLYIGSS